MISLLAFLAREGLGHADRLDDLLELALDLRFGSCTRSGGSRRARTSCWVIVEAPRLEPRSESSPAETMATGSKPAFSQNVLSSMAVVASSRIGGISSKVTTSRLNWPNRASSDLAGAVVEDRFLGQLVLRQLVRVLEAGRQRAKGHDHGQGRDDPDAGEEREHDEGQPAERGAAPHRSAAPLRVAIGYPVES